MDLHAAAHPWIAENIYIYIYIYSALKLPTKTSPYIYFYTTRFDCQRITLCMDMWECMCCTKIHYIVFVCLTIATACRNLSVGRTDWNMTISVECRLNSPIVHPIVYHCGCTSLSALLSGSMILNNNYIIARTPALTPSQSTQVFGNVSHFGLLLAQQQLVH